VRVVVCGSEEGEMLVKVGPGPGVTMNVRELLVPPGVVTVTLRRPTEAVGEIVNLTVAVEVGPELIEKALVVIPLPASTVIGPKKLFPVRVTSKVVPRFPEFGLMVLNTGGGGMT
jgi:hypothetical protein